MLGAIRTFSTEICCVLLVFSLFGGIFSRFKAANQSPDECSNFMFNAI